MYVCVYVCIYLCRLLKKITVNVSTTFAYNNLYVNIHIYNDKYVSVSLFLKTIYSCVCTYISSTQKLTYIHTSMHGMCITIRVFGIFSN